MPHPPSMEIVLHPILHCSVVCLFETDLFTVGTIMLDTKELLVSIIYPEILIQFHFGAHTFQIWRQSSPTCLCEHPEENPLHYVCGYPFFLEGVINLPTLHYPPILTLHWLKAGT